LLLYLALLLLASTFSLIGSGLYAFQKNFLKILLTLHVVAIMSIGIVAGITLYNKRSGLKELLSNTKEQAARDIQADSIYHISYGFPHLDSNYFKRDSIMAKYGIHHTSTCVIDQFNDEKDAYYEQLTQDYLDQRNGKNWKAKMQKELALYPAH